MGELVTIEAKAFVPAKDFIRSKQFYQDLGFEVVWSSDDLAWWGHVQAQGLIDKYGVWAEPPADRSWGIRDFVIVDPTGVLWRIGQNIDPPSGEGA